MYKWLLFLLFWIHYNATTLKKFAVASWYWFYNLPLFRPCLI